jgi:signal transduction histidine kinase
MKIDPTQVLLKAFPGLSTTEAEKIISISQVKTYPKNTTLTTENKVEFTFFILISGQVKVTKLINTEEARFLKHLESGDFFGEMALIHDAPRAATVITTRESTVLEIEKANFDQLLRDSSILSMAMVREVSRRLRENDEMAIADLRKKTQELTQALNQLAEQEQARSEFLTTIAHELRTPLMAASGFMQIIRSGQLEGEKLHTAMNTVARHLKDITALTKDILFLQEMELILPDFQETEVNEVIQQSILSLHSAAEENHVEMNFHSQTDLPLIYADKQSLERAFQAIIDNAIKFSPDGGIIEIQTGEENRHIIISIKDQGVGIPDEALPHIFDRFFHIDRMDGNLFGGVGLGLSIAKQVIEQHIGSIEVDTRLGQGTTFTIHLRI